MPALSLQDTTAPEGVCYGCGSSNPHGLHIKICKISSNKMKNKSAVVGAN